MLGPHNGQTRVSHGDLAALMAALTAAQGAQGFGQNSAPRGEGAYLKDATAEALRSHLKDLMAQITNLEVGQGLGRSGLGLHRVYTLRGFEASRLRGGAAQSSCAGVGSV